MSDNEDYGSHTQRGQIVKGCVDKATEQDLRVPAKNDHFLQWLGIGDSDDNRDDTFVQGDNRTALVRANTTSSALFLVGGL